MSEQQMMPRAPRYIWTLSGTWFSVAIYGGIRFLQRHRRIRILAGVVGCIAAVFAALSVTRLIPFTSPNVFWILGLSVGLIWLVTLASDDFDVKFPSQDATNERKEAELNLGNSNNPNDLLVLDFKRLNEYYVINQSQAKSSFRWAVFAMIFGLATIVAGIWIFYFRREASDRFIASLSTAAGIIVNLVSGLFLVLFNKTQERSLYYFQQLSQIQKIALAMRLVDSQSDQSAKLESQRMVIEQLLNSEAQAYVGRNFRPENHDP